MKIIVPSNSRFKFHIMKKICFLFVVLMLVAKVTFAEVDRNYDNNHHKWLKVLDSWYNLPRFQPNRFDEINFIIPVAKIACTKKYILDPLSQQDEINICVGKFLCSNEPYHWICQNRIGDYGTLLGRLSDLPNANIDTITRNDINAISKCTFNDLLFLADVWQSGIRVTICDISLFAGLFTLPGESAAQSAAKVSTPPKKAINTQPINWHISGV